MKKYDEMTITEQQEIAKLFGNWLKNYTHEVILEVMKNRDDIINNDFAMNLLIELKEREDKEEKDFCNEIAHLLYNFEDFKEYNPHNHPLTHSSSYRDVLYDIYIKQY